MIPGGAHTYSRGSDQFPSNSPSGITHGKGAYVWDIDGNKLLDWGMALGSVSLGHAFPSVNEAVIKSIEKGVNFTRPSQLEYDAADKFLSMTDSKMVKFAKHGSSITTAAVKLARAYTGRNKIAVPIEHPFFSFDDWFIASTKTDFGIPKHLKSLTIKFSYNNLRSLEDLIAQNPGEIACVILEPVKIEAPIKGFLEGIRALCDKHGIILIFDEMISGLKWSVPGAGDFFKIESDLSTWGKGIANGFSCSALTGKREIMRLGGIEDEGRQKLFLLSTTHGAEATGLAAMLATVNVFLTQSVVEQNWKIGKLLKERLSAIIKAHRLDPYLSIKGYPCVLTLETLGPNKTQDLAFRTLFLQEVIAKGVLYQGVFVLTPSHGITEIEFTEEAFDHACTIYCRALDNGGVGELLMGPSIKPVFRSFN